MNIVKAEREGANNSIGGDRVIRDVRHGDKGQIATRPTARGGRRAPENMNAKEFDRLFEREEDATAALDFGAARRPALEQRRVNVDFPTWTIDALAKEAARLGVTGQSVIKTWIADRLERRREAA